MSKKRTISKPKLGRREFMQGVLAGGGAVAVTLAGGDVAAQPETTTPEAVAQGSAAQGYHETAHIRDYYKTVAE